MEGSRNATATTSAAAAAVEDSSSQRNPFDTPGVDNIDTNPFATPAVATPAAESVTSRQLGQTRNTSSFDDGILSILFCLWIFPTNFYSAYRSSTFQK
jgi:small neutral amino acid transporter SnatA (MarC family)